MIKATVMMTLAAAALLGCSAKKRYPDPAAGWHSLDYSVVFGRLTRVPMPAPDPSTPAPPPAWVLKFGEATDQYGGEFALTPPEKLVGYSGGEPVEVRGRLMEGGTSDPYNGRWYVVDSIRMWHGHR
jgi:hypothetical protein